jgi:hypothetical protein
MQCLLLLTPKEQSPEPRTAAQGSVSHHLLVFVHDFRVDHIVSLAVAVG